LISAELLYGSLTLPVILPALACSWIATAVSWVYLPTHATYVNVPSYPLRASLVYSLWSPVRSLGCSPSEQCEPDATAQATCPSECISQIRNIAA
jgi:hypothetical protein